LIAVASHHIAPSLDNAEFWAGMQALVQQAMRLEIAPLAEKLLALQEEVHHIHEQQAAATGALQDALTQQTAAIEGMMDACQMSTASKAKHLFKFEALECDPPMVQAQDKRVRQLVKLLDQARSQSSRQSKTFTSDEKWCRDKYMIPFFRDVAKEYGVGTIEPNESIYELKVLNFYW
jgi:HPt (histidine-containing phosphotransfer) domain-containing protein